MSVFEIFLIGIGLAMDAFAVSVCKGMAVQKVTPGQMCSAGLWFGGFQALMPVIGYYAGSLFAGYIEKVDHWIAFILLALIGINMIREALSGGDAEEDASFAWKTMLLMAIATSIDALAVGVTFSLFSINIWMAVAIIGITTFVLSACGVRLGSVFGMYLKSRAEILGGGILIIIGLRILLEHLGIIG